MKSILTFFSFLIISLQSIAQSRYVDGTNGSDGNNGTSLATAWRTIQKACNETPAGSTVYIKGGTYTESLWMNTTGTVGNYITFTQVGSDIVIIDGGSTNTQVELLNIETKSYIKIIGLQFANAKGNFSKGIAIREGSDNIEIRNCVFHDIHFSTNSADAPNDKNSNPLIVYNTNPTNACSNIIFSGNLIYNCRTGVSEACTMTGNVDGFEISNNIVHDITNIGIDVAGGHTMSNNASTNYARNGIIKSNTVYNCVSALAVSAGIYVDGGKNIIVERNISHDNGRGFEIGCEIQNYTADNVVLRNNISYHNREAGIGIGGYNYPSTGKVANSKILNNTCFDNVFINNGDGELLIEYSENCIIEQNVFYATNASNKLLVARLNSTGLSLNYNTYYHTASSANVDWNGTPYVNFTSYKVGTSQDGNSLFTNPKFVSASSQNFNLMSNSPCINAGRATFLPASGETDFAGNARISGSKVDIGAYEYQTVLSVDDPHSLKAKRKFKSILLEWVSCCSTDIAYFEIMRSTDGQVFTKIGSIPNRNNILVFEDKEPSVGLLYYQIVGISNIGKKSRSETVSTLWINHNILIYPNPTEGDVTIDNDIPFSQIIVMDVLGKIVKTIDNPNNNIDLNALPKGIYQLIGIGYQKEILFSRSLTIL